MTPSPLSHHPSERVGQRVLFNLAALVVVLAGIRLASDVLIPLLLAAFIAVMTAPLITWLQRYRVPRALGTVLAIVIDVAAVVGLGVVLVSSVNSLYGQLPRYQAKLVEWIEIGAAWLRDRGVEVQTADLQSVFDPASLVNLLSGIVASLATLLSNVALILLIVAFLLIESAGIRDKLEYLLQRSWSQDAQDNPFKAAAKDIQKYLGVKTLTSLTTGVLVGTWFSVLGVDFAVLWGVLAFLFNYIPNIGSFIAVAPPIFVAFVMQGPGVALATGLGSFIVNFTIGNIIEPRALGKALGLSPVIVLTSMVFWGWLLGPFGAIISVPLTMVVKIGLSHSDDMAWIAVLLKPPPKLSKNLPGMPSVPEEPVPAQERAQERAQARHEGQKAQAEPSPEPAAP